MKYNLILVGKNNAIMDEFFNLMKVSFHLLSSSLRLDDIYAHLELALPDAVVFCLYNETREQLSHIAKLKQTFIKQDISLFIIGGKEECEKFTRDCEMEPDLILCKPLTAQAIQNRILDFLEEKEAERQRKEEEMLRLQEEHEQIREQCKEAEEQAAAKLMELRERIQNQNRRKHILIIDDDPLMLKLMKEHLIDKYDVATALSGKIAYKFLAQKTTDLILLDYAMPVESGPEVLEKLRAEEKTKDIPVVFLTGITEKEKIQKALVLKPRGYLLKPIEKDRLLEVIGGIIG